jgi:hypothetical protein
MTPRPQNLAEVAARAENLQQFGWEFRDWQHTLRSVHSRTGLKKTIEAEPVRLRDRFPEGAVADAWLAAYAEHLAIRTGLPVPDWTDSPDRIAPEPWFATDHPGARLRALRDSPPAFKNRNLFTEAVDLPLRLRAGRPPKRSEEKRRTNAGRQRRFRARRALELELLRQAGEEVMAG